MNQSLPGVTKIVAQATAEFPRHSEGDMIELADGRLLLAWGRKEGAEDFDRGSIIGAFSHDGGATWDEEPHTILEPWGDLHDVMSISLARSPRGVHLFFLGNSISLFDDSRVYQMLSTDEGETWSAPQEISLRHSFQVLNNARVIRLSSGRFVAPIACTDNIETNFGGQFVFCLLSDDDGATWQESDELVVDGVALMEPGVAECADGSIYMSIRTGVGWLYEARSSDGGQTWSSPVPTAFVSASAPSTVVKDPGSNDLWMFWCANPKGAETEWSDRNPQMLAISHDNGHTWGPPRPIEDDTNKSFGYISVTVVRDQVHLTYYDWTKGQYNFYMCNLRQRTIPIGWFRDG